MTIANIRRRWVGLRLRSIDLGWVRDEQLRIVAAIGAIAAVVYVWSGVAQQDTDGWFPLADAFLHGRLWIENRPWIELVPGGDGRYYLPFPPIPAVVLMPIVAIAGAGVIDTSATTGIVGGLDVALAFLVVRRFVAPRQALVLTVAFAFGTEAFYAAAQAGPHLWAETLGMSFELAALGLAVRHRHSMSAGALLLLAAGCRPTYLLAAPAFLLLYARHPYDRRVARRLAAFVAGALPIGLLLLAYNVARFGDPFQFGYSLITGPNGERVLDEPWYSHGIVSPLYLPRGLYTMFLRTFDFQDNFPWLKPSWGGLSILLTMPALGWLVRALWPSRLVVAGWLGLVLPLTVDLMHGITGYAQFGYRFFLDGLPFAWLLLALVVRRYGLSLGLGIALVVGIVVNTFGVWAVSTGFMNP